MTAPLVYRGRFAPSPTGPLHFGSLVAAVGSWLEARSRGGEWLVRMEDLDRPREAPGAAGAILRTLEHCGLTWDGAILHQRERDPAYAAALERLRARGLAYPCACSRREVAARGRPGPEGPIYPGTCRDGLPPGRRARSQRLRVAGRVAFHDALQGPQQQDLAAEVGDFVLRRADGLFSYQLAVVVDDAAQGITHVVRGADLLTSTARQIHLQRLLGLPTPAYAHLPVATAANGDKLSKQTGARAVDDAGAAAAVAAALDFLGHPPPPALTGAGPAALLDWAVRAWRLERVPTVTALPAASVGAD